MSDNATVKDVNVTEQIVSRNTEKKSGLEELALLVQAERIQILEKKMLDKTNDIKKRQEDVRKLHELMSKINTTIDSKDRLNISENQELKDLVEKARELGVDIEKDKTSWTKDEKDRLVENLRMKCEDLSNQNQLELQDTQSLMNQRYEVYEMTKSIMKPLHEDKINKARKTAG